MASPLSVCWVVGDELDCSPDPLSVAEYRAPRSHRTSALPSTAARTMVVNHGRDTLVMLGDGSTILVKGVADIDAVFLS